MSSREDGGEDDSRDDLIEDTLLYVSEKKYPENCNPNRKRQIRKKAEKFVVVDGELYYKKGRNEQYIISQHPSALLKLSINFIL